MWNVCITWAEIYCVPSLVPPRTGGPEGGGMLYMGPLAKMGARAGHWWFIGVSMVACTDHPSSLRHYRATCGGKPWLTDQGWWLMVIHDASAEHWSRLNGSWWLCWLGGEIKVLLHLRPQEAIAWTVKTPITLQLRVSAVSCWPSATLKSTTWYAQDLHILVDAWFGSSICLEDRETGRLSRWLTILNHLALIIRWFLCVITQQLKLPIHSSDVSWCLNIPGLLATWFLTLENRL